jgi:hypothetical protein
MRTRDSCLENWGEDTFHVGDKQERARDKGAITDNNGRDELSTKLATQMQSCQTLSELQAAMRSQPQGQMLITVNATEVGADSDSSDSNDDSASDDSSDESYESDSHDDDDDDHDDIDTRICSHDSDAGMKRVVYMANTLSLETDGNNKGMDTSMYKNAKGEQDDDRRIWEQQPRVFISR